MLSIDYRYLRPKKAEALKKWYDAPVEVRENPEIWQGSNATVLPLRRDDQLLFGRGGVVDEEGEDAAAGDDFLRQVNPDSLRVVHGYGEPWLADAKVGDSFQFLRTAYFCKDKDSTDEMAVFNRVVSLKDSFKLD